MVGNTIIRLPVTFQKGHMEVISAEQERITVLSLLAVIQHKALWHAALFRWARTRPGSVQIMKWILSRHAQSVLHCGSAPRYIQTSRHKGPSHIHDCCTTTLANVSDVPSQGFFLGVSLFYRYTHQWSARPGESTLTSPSVLHAPISFQDQISNELWWLCAHHATLHYCSGLQSTTTALLLLFPQCWQQKPVSQSDSVTVMHRQQACPEKQLWQAQKRKCLLYESCVFRDLCLFIILATCDGGEWRLPDALTTLHGPVLWNLNDEVMDFVVDKVGHTLSRMEMSLRRRRDCSKQGVTLLLNYERSTLIDILIYSSALSAMFWSLINTKQVYCVQCSLHKALSDR